MAWRVINEARVVKCNETGRVGIMTEPGGNVKVIGSGEGGGVSPTAKVVETAEGAVITIEDENGKTTATVYNGKDGADGTPGKDGADGTSYTAGTGIEVSEDDVMSVSTVNKNYIDNSDFSINQTGQAEYTEAGYTVDRWYIDNGSVTVADNGIIFTNPLTEGLVRLKQDIPYGFEVFAGKTLTLSAKIDGEVYSGTGTIPTEKPTGTTTIQYIATGITAWGLNLNYVVASDCFVPYIALAYDRSINIEWVKLEVSENRTPYLEPDYMTELIKTNFTGTDGKLSLPYTKEKTDQLLASKANASYQLHQGSAIKGGFRSIDTDFCFSAGSVPEIPNVLADYTMQFIQSTYQTNVLLVENPAAQDVMRLLLMRVSEMYATILLQGGTIVRRIPVKVSVRPRLYTDETSMASQLAEIYDITYTYEMFGEVVQVIVEGSLVDYYEDPDTGSITVNRAHFNYLTCKLLNVVTTSGLAINSIYSERAFSSADEIPGFATRPILTDNVSIDDAASVESVAGYIKSNLSDIFNTIREFYQIDKESFFTGAEEFSFGIKRLDVNDTSSFMYIPLTFVRKKFEMYQSSISVSYTAVFDDISSITLTLSVYGWSFDVDTNESNVHYTVNDSYRTTDVEF